MPIGIKIYTVEPEMLSLPGTYTTYNATQLRRYITAGDLPSYMQLYITVFIFFSCIPQDL